MVQFLLHFAMQVGRYGLQFFISDRFGLGSEGYAYLISYVGVVGAINSGLALGPLIKRFDEASLITGSTIFLVISYFFTAIADSLPMYLFLLSITSLSATILGTVTLSQFTRAFPREETGFAMGVGGSTHSVGGIAAPLAGGFLTQYLGTSAPALCAAVVVGGSYFVSQSAIRAERADSKKLRQT